MRLKPALSVMTLIVPCVLCGCTKPHDSAAATRATSVPDAATTTSTADTVIHTKLHRPLGTVVKVEGEVFDGPSKGYEDGPNLRVRRIDGVDVTTEITIRLAPYFVGFGETCEGQIPVPALKAGRCYEFEGYETGGFVGVPDEAHNRAGILLQTTDHYFRSVLNVYKGRQIGD